jgi:uncharacterized protein (TIGR02996 family)
MGRPLDFVDEQIPDLEEQSLVRHILKEPDDDQARLVYADWLEERGDPRAEFLRIQCALKNDPVDKKLLARQTKLRGKIRPEWLSIVGDTLARFAPLQEAVWNSDRERGWKPFLKVKTKAGLLDVHYHGNLATQEHPIDEVLDFLASQEVARVLHTLILDGHEDRGRSNGTLHFPLERLVERKSTFSNLVSLIMEQGSGIIIGSNYQESGLLARLLHKAPRLLRLTAPSAPNHEFFNLKSHPLQALSIAVGYDHQNFIENLSRSSCFPDLRELEYFDYGETYMNDYRQRCTPFDHFRILFRSPVFAQFKQVNLRGVQLTQGQVESLLAIRRKSVTITRADDVLLA